MSACFVVCGISFFPIFIQHIQHFQHSNHDPGVVQFDSSCNHEVEPKPKSDESIEPKMGPGDKPGRYSFTSTFFQYGKWTNNNKISNLRHKRSC